MKTASSEISKTSFQETAGFTKGKLVACPRSWDNGNLETDFKIHYVSKRELKSNGGICAACRKRILRGNQNVVSGHKVETPADLNAPRHHADLDRDNCAFVAPGDYEPATWFNHDDVDAMLGTIEAAPDDARTMAADLVAQIFEWCFPRNGKTPLRLAAARLACLVSGLRPALLDGRSLQSLAGELGQTKAALSTNSLHAQERFGLKFSRSRSAEARQHMALRQLGHPARNKKVACGHARRKDS